MATVVPSDRGDFTKYIWANEIGRDQQTKGPFGRRKVLYADYTASGRALRFIEDYIRNEILPWYGNTHTATAVTSHQMTLLREEARLIFRNAVNASEYDCVIFTGSGTTGAVNLLIHAMGLHRAATGSHKRLVVFHGLFEHHSNLLPWRELGAEMVAIGETEQGVVDLEDLENKLRLYSGGSCLAIGAFSAGSNLTGVLTDTDAVTSLLHRYGGLAFWDYATAAPYVTINMNPVNKYGDQKELAKDAIFFSVHKFIGGVDSPGVLIAKKSLFSNHTPFIPGGGTVFFVNSDGQLYWQEIESREEGGTPAIIGSIRAGLAMQLKEAVGSDWIMKREHDILCKVHKAWNEVPELILLGPEKCPKLPVFSFVIKQTDSGLYLHHNFVCALLNDLFGIQSRGGCSCAGPYAQSLLGLTAVQTKKYQELLMEDRRLDRIHLRRQAEHSEKELLRPGVTRLSFTYFMADEAIDYIIQAVTMIAKHGWKLLPLYDINPDAAIFTHANNKVFKDRMWLGSISYSSGKFEHPSQNMMDDPPNFKECLQSVENLFERASACQGDFARSLGNQALLLGVEGEEFRWFVYPQEVQQILQGKGPIERRIPPFSPKQYKEDGLKDSKPIPASIHMQLLSPSSLELGTVHEASSDKGYMVIHEKLVSDVSSQSLSPVGTCSVGIQCSLLYSDEKVPSSNPNESRLLVSVPQNTHISVYSKIQFHSPPKAIFNPTKEAIEEYKMIADGDRILVCLSGGKDSLSLLHTLHQYQFRARASGVHFTLGAVTVDPKTSSYDPSPLIPYLKALGVPYYFEEQKILEKALEVQCSSICSFCSRMKRGRLYACARREGFNVLAFGQHLDDLAESFLMAIFHNGFLRTMKAHYIIKEGDLRVIRPFVYVREKDLRVFANQKHLPVIPENCPACFEAPKERHRMKQLLAAQEILFPKLFSSLQAAMRPLMARNKTGIESRKSECFDEGESD